MVTELKAKRLRLNRTRKSSAGIASSVFGLKTICWFDQHKNGANRSQN